MGYADNDGRSRIWTRRRKCINHKLYKFLAEQDIKIAMNIAKNPDFSGYVVAVTITTHLMLIFMYTIEARDT